MTLQSTSNQAMAGLMEQNLEYKGALSEELTAALQSGLTQREGCVVLQTFAHSAGGYSPALHFDKTGYECLVNHIHIDPVAGEDGLQPLRMGLAYAQKLTEILQNSGYRQCFQIIVSFHLTDQICTVRFHTKRPGEHGLAEDLEQYRKEAIQVIRLDSNQT
jgi:hypothetical protein